MSNVLVVGEIKDGVLKKVSKELVSAGKKLADGIGGKADVLLIGDGADKFAAELGAAGAEKVLVASVGDFNPEAYANAVAAVIKEKGYKVVLL
ncbi:MAG TPA: electron transfer flavoprotein subunit alpha/FixB family protein, partial [Leptospiraceae bacterium]|nr:electron transfer flavoprotein subunit alpha/FixB family protein [Leptospiraceae bacterium]